MSESMKPIARGLGPLFADLERRAQATLDLAARIRAALPGPEKDHVVSASYHNNTLVVTADSAAWAARIRYAQHDLLAQLQLAGETQVTRVKVRVGRGRGGGDRVIG